MDNSLKKSMFQYYDERASEYDEIYLFGKGPASISNTAAYIEETNRLKTVVKNICFGKILDIPCGTVFWLQSYSDRCDSILLVDQSDIESFGSKHSLKIEIHHFGSTFCAFTGKL